MSNCWDYWWILEHSHLHCREIGTEHSIRIRIAKKLVTPTIPKFTWPAWISDDTLNPPNLPGGRAAKPVERSGLVAGWSLLSTAGMNPYMDTAYWPTARVLPLWLPWHSLVCLGSRSAAFFVTHTTCQSAFNQATSDIWGRLSQVLSYWTSVTDI